MPRDPPGALMDLQGGERAVRGDPLGLRLLDVAEERPGQLHGELEILRLHPPRAVDRRAPLDDLHRRPGQPQHVRGAGAHVLRLQVARQLIADGTRRLGEARVEPPLVVQ